MARVKPVLFLLVIMVLLAACQQQPVSQLLCPINYDLLGEDCRLSTTNPDPVKYVFLPALQLLDNQMGIYNPPGDVPLVLVRGIGFHEIPAAYSFVYPTNLRTIKTERELTNQVKCSAESQAYGECDTPLDGIRLLGGIAAEVDYEIDLRLTISEGNAGQFAELGGYPQLVNSLTSYIRSSFRNSENIDPVLYYEGGLTNALMAHYGAILGLGDLDPAEDWPFTGMVDIVSLRLRSITLVGVDTQSPQLANNYAVQAAETFEEQMSIICAEIQDEFACAYTMSIFQWSASGGEGQPPVMPLVATQTP